MEDEETEGERGGEKGLGVEDVGREGKKGQGVEDGGREEERGE